MTCCPGTKPTVSADTGGDTENIFLMASTVWLEGLPGTGMGSDHSAGGLARMRFCSSPDCCNRRPPGMDDVATDWLAACTATDSLAQ